MSGLNNRKGHSMKIYSTTVFGRTFESTDWRRLCKLAVTAYLEGRGCDASA
jgi:hypothetical protein